MLTAYFPSYISWLPAFQKYLPSVCQTIFLLWQTFHCIKFCCLMCRANDFCKRKMGIKLYENIMRKRRFFVVVLNSSEVKFPIILQKTNSGADRLYPCSRDSVLASQGSYLFMEGIGLKRFCFLKIEKRVLSTGLSCTQCARKSFYHYAIALQTPGLRFFLPASDSPTGEKARTTRHRAFQTQRKITLDR